MNYESCIKGLTPEKLMIASSYLKGLVDGCGIVTVNDEKKQTVKKRDEEKKGGRA